MVHPRLRMIQDATKHSRIFDLLVVPKHVSPLPSNFEASNRYLKKWRSKNPRRRVPEEWRFRNRNESEWNGTSLVEHTNLQGTITYPLKKVRKDDFSS